MMSYCFFSRGLMGSPLSPGSISCQVVVLMPGMVIIEGLIP